jgi:LacI family transcriptional regulator
VLNGSPSVRDDTKQQVNTAIRELNYVVPLLKRGPKPGAPRKSRGIPSNGKIALSAVSKISVEPPAAVKSTGTIAVIAVGDGKDWLQMPVMAACVSGISREARNTGQKILLEEMLDHTKPPAVVLDRQVDGAIVFLSSSMTLADFSVALSALNHVPLVWAMGGDVGLGGVDHVIPDDRAVARLAFDYLSGIGCRQLAFITGRPRWAMMRNRGQEFAGMAHDARLGWSAYVASDDQRDGELFGARTVVERTLDALVDRLVKADPRPDGIFISNDAVTAIIQPMLLQRGMVPGRDVSLVSCDNEQVRLDGLLPRPMSIDIAAGEVGAVCVKRLQFRMVNPSDAPVLIKIVPFLPTTKSGYLV